MLREDQTYRIDHYLGKETVQNILAFRFANAHLGAAVERASYVDHVQLTVAEAIGVEGRGGYFEQAGIVRDMVQNHMFQFLCLIGDGAAGRVRGRRGARREAEGAALAAAAADRAEDVERFVVRGQYGAGFVDGQELHRLSRGEGRGDPDSRVETYVAHQAVHRQLALGGRAVLSARRQGAAQARHRDRDPLQAARRTRSSRAGDAARLADEPNVLSIRIQPDEGIALKFFSKVPGPTMEVLPVPMEFRYGTSFGAEPPEAYERLILDCLLGDGTLFTRGDEVEASWAWIDRIEKAWSALPPPPFPNYAAGTLGAGRRRPA